MDMKQKLNKIVKKSLIFSVAASSLIGLSACKSEIDQNYIDNAFAIVYQGKTPYLINKDKETFNLSEYDQIIEIFNTYIGVKKDGKYGFINNRGEQVVSPIYDRIYPMYEDKAVVILNGEYKIIDNKGNILYSFVDGVTSESYFSSNHLVVSKDNKYGYLEFIDNEFILHELDYDYAGVFKDDYSVIGKKEEIIVYKVDELGNETSEIESVSYLDNLKYNFYKKDNTVLLSSWDFDFADCFYDGWARVGVNSTINATIVGNKGTKSYDGLMYSYINPEGEFFHMDYYYTYIDQKGNQTPIHDDYKIEFPYATNFNDGLCVTAKYLYSTVVNQYVKEYMVIDTTGNMEYVDAVHTAPTGFLYGYDHLDDYQSQSPGQYWIGKISKIDDTYLFRVGNTMTNQSWRSKFIQWEFERNYNMFVDVRWENYPTTSIDGVDTVVHPDWMIDYNEKYVNGTSSFILVESAARVPYEMDDIEYSKYYSDTNPITKVRIIRSNQYGILEYTTKKRYVEEYDTTVTDVYVSYLIDPIYDKIIY